jgi:DNA-binding response OmpR family regulator
MNILIIDDDKDFLFLLGKTMRKKGYGIYTAPDGISALEELHEHPIDLIISDVIMADTPIMSLTCILKTRYPGTPIILVSGLPSGSLIRTTLALGADEFIPKPIDLGVLYGTIDRLKKPPRSGWVF